MNLIVDEEKLKLINLKTEIGQSSMDLDPHKEEEELTKQNDIVKKEINRIQKKNLKMTKQSKFKRDLLDWEKDEIFDLSSQRVGIGRDAEADPLFLDLKQIRL